MHPWSPPLGPHLLALHTLHGKLLLIAGHAVVVVLLGDEALGADGLLTTLAAEAGLMPAVAFVLHFPGALWWEDRRGPVGQGWGDIQIVKEAYIKKCFVLDAYKFTAIRR